MCVNPDLQPLRPPDLAQCKYTGVTCTPLLPGHDLPYGTFCSYFFLSFFCWAGNQLKEARNEVKNSLFAQRSVHREVKNMATGIDRTGHRAQATGVDDDGRSNRPTPTHRFCHSAIFHPITPCNVWFFWVSRHRSIILAKKCKHFRADFEFSRKCVKSWIMKNLN